MCLPALGAVGSFLQANQLLISAASTALTFIGNIQKQQADRDQAKRQNEIAFRSRLNKERAEGLRIRQVRKGEQSKLFQSGLESKQAQATVRTAAEGFGGGVLDRLVNDYLRQEGRYNSSVLANLEAENAQSRANYELFVNNQEAQTAYVPKVDYVTTFASSAFAFANDYYGYQTQQEQRRREEQIANQNKGVFIG